MTNELTKVRRLVEQLLEDPEYSGSGVASMRLIAEWALPLFGQEDEYGGVRRLMPWAIESENEPLVRRLVELGLSLEMDECGDSPLKYAFHARRENVVLLLLELGADPNSYYAGGYTPLHLAVEYGMHRAIDKLRTIVDDTNKPSLDDYKTALEMTRDKGDVKAEKLLLRGKSK